MFSCSGVFKPKAACIGRHKKQFGKEKEEEEQEGIMTKILLCCGVLLFLVPVIRSLPANLPEEVEDIVPQRSQRAIGAGMCIGFYR